MSGDGVLGGLAITADVYQHVDGKMQDDAARPGPLGVVNSVIEWAVSIAANWSWGRDARRMGER